MRYTLLSPILTIFLSLVMIGCSGGSQEQPAAARNDREPRPTTPVTSETPPSTACVPSAANNNCATLETLSGAEKCWVKVLDTEAAKACAAKGKVFNRISKACVENLSVKACTEAEVVASLDKSFTGASAEIEKAKKAIKDKLGVDAQLDQCGSVTYNNNEVLVPIFIGKKFEGDSSGVGKYKIHASKVCFPNTGTAGDCSNAALSFVGSAEESVLKSCE